MPHRGSSRTCGNCGAAVERDAIVCPTCDALLAAYEAPSGSATASDAALHTAFESKTVITPEPVIVPPQRRDPEPFDAEAAMADARRVLGMPTTPSTITTTTLDPAPIREPDVSPEPVPVVEPTSEPMRQTEPRHRTAAPIATAQAPIPTPPARPQPQPQPQPRPQPTTKAQPRKELRPQTTVTATAPPNAVPETVQESLPELKHPYEASAPAPEGVTGAQVITGAQIVKWGILLMIFLMFMRALPFGISPVFFIVFAFFILGNVMKGSAKAGGRKTTTMYDPNKRDQRRR